MDYAPLLLYRFLQSEKLLAVIAGTLVDNLFYGGVFLLMRAAYWSDLGPMRGVYFLV